MRVGERPERRDEVRPGRRGPAWRLGVCLFALAIPWALVAGCGGHGGASPRASYLGREPSGLVFVQWTRSGDAVSGSISIAGPINGNMRQLTQPLTGTIDGDTVTLSPSGVSVSPLTATISGTHVHMGPPMDIDLVAATVADYNAAAVALIPQVSQDELAVQSRDAAVKEGIHSIQIGIQSYAVDHADTYPPDAAQATLARYVDTWPSNPYTNLPMMPGTTPGNFYYSTNGSSFQLVGYGADGQALITVP
jgi:hypothetical protein